MRGAEAKNPLWLASGARLTALPLVCMSLLCLVPVLISGQAQAATPVHFSGELGGLVTDVAGKPQPGAIVILLNRQDRILQKIATDALGTFAFSELMPDLYSVQVSLSSFIPAVKERIQIRAGMRSLLAINLSRVFSSVQLISMTPLPGGLMSDNWKWTVRADNASRSILRILPAQRVDSPSSEPRESVFSGSRGLIRVSAGDGAHVTSSGEADLGTQFAFATSVYGENHIEVAGDLGYAPVSGGSQSAAFRTTYSRDFAGAKPSLSVTMRQFYMPMRIGQTLAGGPGDTSLPALKTLGVSFSDKTQLTDAFNLEYGFELNSVSFINRLQYFSPYAKLTRNLEHGHVDFTWTSGNARPELGITGTEANADLQRNLAALATLPRVTLVGGQPKIQRGSDYELSVTERAGSREYSVSSYYDDVSNTTLTIASPQGDLFPGDVLPDLFSNSALFNAGRFRTFGYNASVTQDLGQNYKVTLIYGAPGVLAPRSSRINGTSAEEFRNVMETAQRPAATLRASGTVKCTGTRFVTSYQWTNYKSAVPGPLFATQSARPEPGLNVMVRQPMPGIPGMPWRMEASAELRNLLAQGYLPLTTAGGQQLLLVNTPRILRGGLAFVF